MSSKRYIVLEGIDASGKSTLAKRIIERLESLGERAIYRFEPTDGPYGRRIRSLLAQPGSERSVSGEEWMNLFLLDREQHTKNVIRPALADGIWVVQDRSFYSTAAYQGSQGVDRETILAKNREVADEPTLVIVIDLSVDEAHRRIASQRAGEMESLEERGYLTQVARVFADLSGPNIQHIDGAQSPDAVLEEAWARIKSRFIELDREE